MWCEHVLYFICAVSFGSAVQINYIKVPVAVKNDSNNPVVMDCNYSLRPDDTDLVIKWFLNDDLVYQWIPPHIPQSFGLLKNRLDLKYRASDDPKTVYRAMKIENPTHEIAGEYKCYVSTFTDEDFSIKSMIVFVPERSLDVIKTGSDDSTVNFTCKAAGVYPIPKLLLYRDTNEEVYNKNRLLTVHWDITKHPDGQYSVYIIASVLKETLQLGSIIRCEMRIPGTGYVKISSLVYYPEALERDKGLRLLSETQVILVFCSVIINYFCI